MRHPRTALRLAYGFFQIRERDSVTTRGQQCLANDVLELAHVAGPPLLLEKFHRFGLNSRRFDPEVGAVSA